jgi:hypothetical protein
VPTKVLVVYYSVHGHVETLARAVGEGAESVRNTEVRLRRVRGVERQVSVVERVGGVLLMLVDGMMHPPVRRLTRVCGDALGCLRGVQRVRMKLGQRKVAEDESQPFAELLLEGQYDRVRLIAVRALEVAVLHQGDRRVRTPRRMIAGLHGRLQHPLSMRAHETSAVRSACMASSASRMPSAPGLTPTGEQ